MYLPAFISPDKLLLAAALCSPQPHHGAGNNGLSTPYTQQVRGRMAAHLLCVASWLMSRTFSGLLATRVSIATGRLHPHR